ncbi:MAG: hypothetical protein AB1758_34260, partial [Candidatus Eremiobacterota bacterium]
MHYFQNPMIPQGTQDPRKKEALAALNRVTQVLKEITQGSQYVYLVELQKLCVAVLSADELGRGRRRRAGGQDVPGPPDELRREVAYQLQAFALLGKLSLEQVQEASQRADERSRSQPGQSHAGFLVEELRRALGDRASEEEARGLDMQPLHWMASARPELLEALEAHVGPL